MTPTTSAINRPMAGAEWAMVLALSLLWGGSFVFVGLALRELPPLSIVTLRVGLAALILTLMLRLMRAARPREPKVWLAFLGMGLLNNVLPFCLIAWGQTQISSGLASILNATTPLFTVLIAHLVTADEKLTPARLAGVVAGLVGVAVMIGPDALSGLGGSVLAQGAVLAGAISYACAGIFGRRFRRLGVPPLTTAWGQVVMSSLVMAPITLLVDRPWTLAVPSAPTWAAVTGLAALSTALAYILYFRILERAGATNLVLVTFLIPVSAILLGTGLLGESLALRHLIGMAAIGLGLAAIDGRLLRRWR